MVGKVGLRVWFHLLQEAQVHIFSPQISNLQHFLRVFSSNLLRALRVKDQEGGPLSIIDKFESFSQYLLRFRLLPQAP